MSLLVNLSAVGSRYVDELTLTSGNVCVPFRRVVLQCSYVFFLFVFLPSGPISSILVNKFGSRPIIILGGCLAGSGLIAASFCNTVEQLYFFIGVVGGEFMCSCTEEASPGLNSEASVRPQQ